MSTKVVEYVHLTLNVNGPLTVDMMFGGIFVMIGDTNRIVPVGFKLSAAEARAMAEALDRCAQELESKTAKEASGL